MQNDQLSTYIRQCLNQGMQPGDIRAKLIQGGWQPSLVDTIMAQSGYTAPEPQITSADPHRVRKGVLWILSPYILFIFIALLQFVVKFVFSSGVGTDVNIETGANLDPDTETTHDSIVPLLVNIFSLLAGIVGVVLIPVGFIIGIIKITKK